VRIRPYGIGSALVDAETPVVQVLAALAVAF
jgi:hypothetical protein